MLDKKIQVRRGGAPAKKRVTLLIEGRPADSSHCGREVCRVARPSLSDADRQFESVFSEDADRQLVESVLSEWRLTESLFSGLELATREYGKDQHAAWSFAVATVVNFLKQKGVEPRLLRPLRALNSAVDDLKYGIVDEGLKPAPFEGGPRVPTNKFLRYVNAAVTVTLLHEDDNTSLDEALTEASKLSGIPKTTLAQFRKNTVAGRRSWKANEFYWIKLRYVRGLFAAPKQRVGYMREYFRNEAPLPQKVP
jgi:hypothetical protein